MKVVWRIKVPLLILGSCLLALFLVRPLILARQNASALHLDGPVLSNPDLTPEPGGGVSSDVSVTSMVNTLIGTGLQPTLPADYNGGETFPGADAPFGMVQWSPDTVSRAYSGYKYSDQRIRGFSLTHLSGAGCSEYGDIPLMPYTGSLAGDRATMLCDLLARERDRVRGLLSGEIRYRCND